MLKSLTLFFTISYFLTSLVSWTGLEYGLEVEVEVEVEAAGRMAS